MFINKKKRFLSGVLIAAVLISSIPVSVYAETGEILSEDDRDARSLNGWVGESIDISTGIDGETVLPIANWYQYELNPLAIETQKDTDDGSNDIFEYCPYFGTSDNSKGKIYKDYILGSSGYYNLSASAEIFLRAPGDTGKLTIELYADTLGTGVPINSSTALSTGFTTEEWNTLSINNLSFTSKVKMIRVVLEASVEDAASGDDYVDFDGLSVSLTQVAAPPIITNLDGDSATFIEGGSAVFLDSGSNVTVTVDSAFSRTYHGGSVTAEIISSYVNTEDVLEIAGVGGITLSGNTVMYDGIVIGTYAGGTSEPLLTVSLNANANDASVAGLIKAIVYRNKNTVNPNILTRTVEVLVSDNMSYTSDSAYITVDVWNVSYRPGLKNGVEATETANVPVKTPYTLDLSTIFEDADNDTLTYKVKVNNEPEEAAAENYTYTPLAAGISTLVFTANDGNLDSTDTYTVTLTAVNTAPVRKSGVEATTSMNSIVNTAISLDLSTIFEDPNDDDLTYKVKVNGGTEETADESYSYTPTAVGTNTLIFRASDGAADSTDTYTVTLTVTDSSSDKTLINIAAPTPVTGIANGSVKSALALGLPERVQLVTDKGTVLANVTWNVAACSYDPDQKTEQNFEVEGTVSLPAGLINPDGVSLDITVDVTVDAESLTDKVLERIYPLTAIKGITNGTAKTVTALGIPARVMLGTDVGNVQADVIWDLDSSSYDTDVSEEQSFTVEGTVVLPDNVINPDGIPLEVSIDVTVLEEETEQEYYTLRIKVTKRPDKVSYTRGEDLDTQGLEVTEYQKASPSNAVRKTVLSEGQYDLEYNLTRTGTRNVKVVYYGTGRDGNEKEFTDVFTVRVKEEPKNDSDDREITEPGKRPKGVEDDQYYSGTWHSDENGWRLTGKDGSSPADRWVYTDWNGSNNWYFFDKKGYMVTGWFEYKGNMYYLNSDSDGKKGYMFTGWNMIEGKWYYFSETADETKGSMLKDTITPDGYRVDPDGARIS